MRIRFYTVSLTSRESQIRFHAQKFSLNQLKSSKKLVKKTLDAFSGEESFIQFSIQFNQKIDSKYQLNARNLFNSHDQYQIAVKQTSKTRVRQQVRENWIFPSKIMQRKSLLEKFSPQRPLSKMLSINRHQHKRSSNNLKQGLNRVQSFQYFNKNQFENEVNSILSQKTFKIQNKDKHIDQLHRQKQVLGQQKQRLKSQIFELNSTIQNLRSKVDQSQKTKKDLQSKIIEKERQLKNKLKEEKILQEQKKQFEELVKTKEKKIKELQNKLQFLTQNYKKRENTLKIQIKNQSSKLSQIGHEKQKLQFELQNNKKNAELKSKIINEINKKQVIEENQEVMVLRKKNLDQQRQIYKLTNTISQINLQASHNITKIRDLSTELANKQSKQAAFKDFISKQNIEINKLKNENLYLNKYKEKQVKNEEKVSQVKKQIEKNMELIISKENQIKQLQKTVSSFQVCFKKLNEQNSLLKSDALSKNTQMKKIQNQKANIVFECEKMKDMNLVLNQKLEDVFKKNQAQRQNFYNKERNWKQKLTEGQRKLRQKQNFIFQLKQQCKKISHQRQILIKRAEEQQKRLKKKTQDLIKQHTIEIQRVEIDLQQKLKNIVQTVMVEEEKKSHKRQSQVRFQYDLKIKQLIRKNQENIHNAQQLIFKTKQKAQIELKVKNKQCNQYIKQLQESKTEYSQLIKKFEQLTKQKSQLVMENYGLSQEIIQKESQTRCAIKQKQTQIQQLIYQYKQKEKVTYEFERKIQIQKQQIDQLQRTKNLLENQKVQFLLQASSLQQKVLELEQQIAIMSEQLQTKPENSPEQTKSQNELESKVSTLETMLDQKIKAIEQIQKQISILKQKQAHLLQITKTQLTAHCNEDKKKLFDMFQKLQKFRNGLKISNNKPAIAAEVFKKMDKLEADLATQKQLAQTNFNQLKTKQIQIEGIKVKYHKYKEQNQKLQTQVEIAKKSAKKSQIQLQNVVIALGETKKQLALLQEQLIAKSIANGNSSKIGSLFVMIKESIRKLEAVAVSNGPNPSSKQNLQKSVIMQKSDSKSNLSPQNLGLNGSSKNSNLKCQDMMDTKSMINFNTKKTTGQKSPKKVTEKKSNQLLIPNLNKKQQKTETMNLVHSKPQKTQDQNDSIKSTYSAIVQPTKTTKEKEKINDNKKFLNIDLVKQELKSNLSNSMMIIDPKKKTQSSFFDDRRGKSDGSAQFSELDSQKMILNESIFCANDRLPFNNQSKDTKLSNSNRNEGNAKKDRNQSSEIIKIIEFENLKESEFFPQINIQLAKSKQSSSNDSVILDNKSSNTKMPSPPSLVPTNNFIHDFTFV